MNVTPKPSLSPEHQRLIETLEYAGWKEYSAALDALALKLARLEQVEAALRRIVDRGDRYLEETDAVNFYEIAREALALLAAREEEGT